MAGDVVNWTFYHASTFVVYWQFCAPKSATALSAKTLASWLWRQTKQETMTLEELIKQYKTEDSKILSCSYCYFYTKRFIYIWKKLSRKEIFLFLILCNKILAKFEKWKYQSIVSGITPTGIILPKVCFGYNLISPLLQGPNR